MLEKVKYNDRYIIIEKNTVQPTCGKTIGYFIEVRDSPGYLIEV
jgi:hypothetical protein